MITKDYIYLLETYTEGGIQRVLKFFESPDWDKDQDLIESYLEDLAWITRIRQDHIDISTPEQLAKIEEYSKKMVDLLEAHFGKEKFENSYSEWRKPCTKT